MTQNVANVTRQVKKSIASSKNLLHCEHQQPNQKDQTMKNQILDILAALAIGLALTVGALAYFDILTK